MTTFDFSLDPCNYTDAAVNDPQVGDRYSEMYSWWLYVVGVTDTHVTTMEASPPCTFPNDAEQRTQTREEFRKRLAYDSIPGYWARLVDRGNDVAGWKREAEGGGG